MRHWHIENGNATDTLAAEVAGVLDDGGVVALPTETYYGLAAHYLRTTALQRIRELKGRGSDKPLLLLVDGIDTARRLVRDAPPDLELLAAEFWPGPLTLVVPALPGLPDPIVSRAGNIALRHSPHPVAQAIASALGAPITATSANLSGEPPAQRPEEIRLTPGVALDGLVDAGPTPGGLTSTVLDLSTARVRVLRAGAVRQRDLKRVLGKRLL